MRTFFGIVFLIGGIMIGLYGINVLSETNNVDSSLGGRIANTFSAEYRSDVADNRTFAWVCIIVGGVLVISSISVISGGTRSHTRVVVQAPNHPSPDNTSVIIARLSKEAENFYNNDDFNSAIGVLKRIIEVDPKQKVAYFNLACCYSLQKDVEAFKYLSLATTFGYNDFKKINSYAPLYWLRTQAIFPAFVKNGYKLPPVPVVSPQTPVLPPPIHRPDIYEQLERLGKLKESGVLTEQEFVEQKKKLLV